MQAGQTFLRPAGSASEALFQQASRPNAAASRACRSHHLNRHPPLNVEGIDPAGGNADCDKSSLLIGKLKCLAA